ncbi:MAG: DUF6946 family protein [Nitrospinales bacterium]
MKKIFIPATRTEVWKAFLASPSHWKKGYSAMSLAYCWQEAEGFPASILGVLKRSTDKLFTDIELLMAFPEYKVSLPGGSAASQNDIFVLSKGNDQLISIMVEGKVSESFGPPVSEWFRNPSPGKKERLGFLCNKLGLEQTLLSNIRYQLLHRTVSAIIEAERFHAPNAMMLVHSFSQSNEWFDDFAVFASLFKIEAELDRIYSAGDIGGINLYLGWVKGEEEYLQREPANENLIGTVTARKCGCCGHHEIGIEADAGEYVPLKPGMKVEIKD